MNYSLEHLFINIIAKGRKDNTYKFALAKCILDQAKITKTTDYIILSYSEISEAFLKYYWIQECKYKIKQDFKTKSQPVVISIIQKACGVEYIPESYEKYFSKRLKLKKKIIRDIEMKCLNDVIPRFQPSEYNLFYKHHHAVSKNGTKFNVVDDKNKNIKIYSESVIFFKKNYELLHKALILEWAKFLEKTNFTPKLIAKIENLGEHKRSSLNKYKKILTRVDNECFYCNTDLKNEKIHIDHFIPWSYIFEDEIWNLVLSCSSCNLKKSDYLAKKECLTKINIRNVNNGFTERHKDINDYYHNCKKSGFLEYKHSDKELVCL